MNKRGFTFLEMSVALLVFALVVVGAEKALVSMQGAWRGQAGVISVVRNIRWAMGFAGNEFRYSTVSASPAWARAQVQGGGERLLIGIDTDGDKSPDTRVWYWRGNGGALGPADTLFRGTGMSLSTANGSRQVVMNFLVDNPSGNDMFSLSSGLLTMEFTGRPDTSRAETAGNRNYTARSMVRVRN